MSVNGTAVESHNGQALAWPRRVLSLADLRKSLNGHREVQVAADAVVTPLAAEELRTNGISIRHQTPPVAPWGQGQDRPHPLVRSALQALAKEGLALREWPMPDGLACRWARAVAECVARGE